uniref:hypothetical protein n=1 Tax=Paractinoplanes polyasparticus TaxID=2856853 RepID=UPI001C856FF3|nr:hypothetical protein [Actinoplanes polyasparticus]
MTASSPNTPATRPASVPGGFSHDRQSADAAPQSAPAHDHTATFLAPPSAEQKPPAARASDREGSTMQTLRHPFDVAAPPSTK